MTRQRAVTADHGQRNGRRQALALGVALLTLAAAGCGTGQLTSQTQSALGTNMPFPFRSLQGATTSLSLHPFGTGTGGLSLFQSGSLSFPEAVQRLVGETMGNGLRVQLTEAALNDRVAAGGKRFEGSFLVNGKPIYGMHMSANLLNDRSSLLLGTLPGVSAVAARTASTTWPDLEATKARVSSHLQLPGSEATLDFGTPTPYYFAASSEELRPVWHMTVRTGGLPYDVVADGHDVYSLENRYFSVDGSATIYAQTVNDHKTVSYALKDLAGDGSLTSNYLQTFLPTGYTKVNEPSEAFNYPVTDLRFAEVNAYSHTDDHFRWMLSIGGQTYGDLPIHVEMHQLPGGTTNNALFMPGDVQSGAPFQIIFGDGDGFVLQNLATDFDVPSHESGHYIIYKYLQTTTGESLAVHEGLADVLVYLQKGIKGDPKAACLGESICPEGSGACIQPGQCLRTGDNNWGYNDATWQQWTEEIGGQCCGHKHGQVLSGVVWDLVKYKAMSVADAANLLMTAISYFKADSGIRDFLLSLLTADKTLFACKYDAPLRQYMATRGLTTLISDVPAGCSNIPAPSGLGSLGQLVNPNTGGGQPGKSTGGSTSRKGGVLGCGVAGLDAGGGLGEFLMMVVAGLAPVILRRRKKD